MTCTAAIINWNSGLRLRTCVESLIAATSLAEIVVIDNASGDGSVEFIQEFRNRVHCVRNTVNRGFAAAVNQAFHLTSTTYVLILNPDLRATPGSVERLEKFLDSHPRAAAVAGYVGDRYLPKRLPTVGRLIAQNLGFGLLDSGGEFRSGIRLLPPEFQAAAAALMIRRDAYDEVGGFDEQFYPAWYEDVDFSQRLRAKGWETYFARDVEFPHEGGYSAEAMGPDNFLRSYYSNQLRYARKHFGVLGAAAVQASIAAGMIGRMIGRPNQAGAYARTFVGALKGW